MRLIILMTTGMLIFLFWESKLPVAVKNTDESLSRIRIKEIEFEKAEETYLYHRARCEQMRQIHQPNHKELMEAELKLKLSRLDLELAGVKKDLD
jgi:hypothetical protein